MWQVRTVCRSELEKSLNALEADGWRIVAVTEGEKWLIGGAPISENKLWNIVMSKTVKEPEQQPKLPIELGLGKAKAAGVSFAKEGEPD